MMQKRTLFSLLLATASTWLGVTSTVWWTENPTHNESIKEVQPLAQDFTSSTTKLDVSAYSNEKREQAFMLDNNLLLERD